MLKLEKARFSDEIDLVYRKKERFFSRRLVGAFALALLFHLSFLVIFRVKLLDTSERLPPLHPVNVTADVTRRPTTTAPRFTYPEQSPPSLSVFTDMLTAPSTLCPLILPDFDEIEHLALEEDDDFD